MRCFRTLASGVFMLLAIGFVRHNARAAIAFDNATSADSGATTTTLTFSHTVTSTANRILFVGVRTSSGVGLISSVTYNGTALTLIDSKAETYNGTAAYLYYLVAPDSGAHNVVINSSSSQYLDSTAVSYTGASGDIDVHGSASAGPESAGQDYTESFTTGFDGDWTVMITAQTGASPAPATGSTQRGTDLGSGGLFVDSNGPITPAGSTSLGLHAQSINNYFGSVMAAFRP